MKYLLGKRYWCFKGENTNVEKIEAEFKSHGLIISYTGHGHAVLNKNGQRKLYELLRKRFENTNDIQELFKQKQKEIDYLQKRKNFYRKKFEDKLIANKEYQKLEKKFNHFLRVWAKQKAEYERKLEEKKGGK